MRRSICYCEPNIVFAGEVNTWTFVYTPSTSLPKGTRLRFDLGSKGRDIDWEIPSIDLKKNENVIYALLENGKILQAKEVEISDCLMPQYEFVLLTELEAEKGFTIIIGSPNENSGNKRKHGTRAQCTAQRRRIFLLYIDTTGKGRYEDPETFTMDVRGSHLCNIRILAPSFVARNKRFDVIVRFEDKFANLTNCAPDSTLIELSHEHLRENLTWKLFVPETGFISLPNLYFNEPGIYTIQLENKNTNEKFFSAPIKCFAENNKHLFWGLLHGESDRIDSTENIESCLRHFRDEKAFNFFAVSPFESAEETSNDLWKTILQNVVEFDENDRFSAFLGFQWQGASLEEGTRQFLFSKDNKQILRKKDQKSNTLQKIYKSFSPKEMIAIPSFTMGKGFEYNFHQFDPEFERVVEIYNAWGSSECSKKEGNPRPITTLGKSGIHENAEGSIQHALQRNCRFGFVAGGLDDRGSYSGFFESDQVQYSPGLTAIIAQEHSRGALMEALFNRSCYATTGERIIIGLYLAGFPMGSETSTAVKPGLLINRHLSGYVAGTAKIKSVEIIRNGKVIKVFEPDAYSFDFTYDDMTSLEKTMIHPKDKTSPFAYYYLRVTQVDDHMAWSSPIWVDYVPPVKAPVNKEAIKRPIKVVKKESSLDLSFDDEGFDDDDDDDDYIDDDDDDGEE